jgi:S-DNA-T family DNA segregation ATPase FtsK/SpoIIIE
MSKSASSGGHSPLRDLLGFVLLALAAFLFLAVASYRPTDPSFNTVVTGPVYVHNFCGVLGSYTADILVQLFGYAAYFIPVFLLGVVAAVVFKPEVLTPWQRSVGVLLFICAATLLLALAAGDIPRLPAWGGVVGHLLRRALLRYVGTAGALLAAFTALAVSFVLAVGVTFRGTLRTVGLLGALPPWFAKRFGPIYDRVAETVGDFLDKEEKQIRKGMDEIRTQSAPKLPKIDKIRIAGVETAPEPSIREPAWTADVIPIVTTKAPKPAEMPRFYTEDPSPEERKPKEHRTYRLPGITLLDAPGEQALQINREELFRNAQILEAKLRDFGVLGQVVEVQPGPVVTMYEFEPAPGVKVNQITRLNDDLALALKAMSVRITPIPGKAVIGIEVANRDRQVVYLKDIVSNDAFGAAASRLTMALGKDISGMPFTADLRKMPHLLVAGATGSGKSVSVNSILISILYKSTPDEVRMILVDPKMLELSLYEDIPHLLLPVVTDPRKAAAALRWAVIEMEKRYRLMADIGVRNIEGYNKKIAKVLEEGSEEKPEAEESPEGELQLDAAEAPGPRKEGDDHDGPMPYIMIVIDELADLMMVSSREVEESIIRLAQMARAAGIHLILATQRPSVDVITGVIKANMPSRISFQVASKIDSRTILDANGAELLLGAGDMLYLPPGTSKLHRIHGAFVTDQEVKKVTDFWKEQGKPDYQHDILKVREVEEAMANPEAGEDEEMYQQALLIAKTYRVASISMIQRKLRIGYNRAARIVERMDEEGLLAPGEVGKPREVMMSRLE